MVFHPTASPLLSANNCRSCPACAAERTVEFLEMETYTLRTCRICRLVWADRVDANPREGETRFDEYLPFPWLAPQERTYEASHSPAFSRDLLARLGPAPAEGRLLDVGTAHGLFLDEAAKGGWKTYGIELSPEAAQVAARRGHRIHCGPMETFHTEESFHAVTFRQVLEHLHSPLRAVRMAAAWLAPGGVLAFEVPNEFESLFGRLRRHLKGKRIPSTPPPAHRFFFTRAAASALIMNAGLKSDLPPYAISQFDARIALHTLGFHGLAKQLPVSVRNTSNHLIGNLEEALNLGGIIRCVARKPNER